MPLARWVHRLAVGQLLVLCVIGIIGAVMLRIEARRAELDASLTLMVGDWEARQRAYQREAALKGFGAWACAGATAVLAFIWFGRRNNSQ